MYRWVVAVVVVVAWAAAVEAQGLDVVTTHGPVQGQLDEQLKIRSFLGIPYGVVDDQNRFKAPRPPEPWTEVLETKQFTKVCPQYVNNEVIGEEDCLVLNVFVPAETTTEEGAAEEEEEMVPLPVLVHVHGGGLQRGSADPDVYGPQRLVPRGIALVVPNYRLGAPGFLCLRNDLAPGNAGLKDLELALHWVADNIRAFGGDPDRITVSGDGAGGGAAGLLALSPNTHGLVRGVISESGSSLSPRILDRNPTTGATDLATALSEGSEDHDDVLSVFGEVEVATLVNAAGHRGDIFLPCIENATDNPDAFLTASPFHLVVQHRNLSIVFMIGSADGAGMAEAAALTAASIANLEAVPDMLLPDDLVFQSDSSRKEAAEKIREQYFGVEGATINKLDDFVRYYTDVNFLGPALRVSRLYAAEQPVYFYEFGYDGHLNYAKRTLGNALTGAARRDIIGYVFLQADRPPDITDEDSLAADRITALWSSFIITGRPALADEQSSWLQLTMEREHFLNISSLLQPSQDVRPERLALWDDLYSAHYIDCASSAPAPPAPARLRPILFVLTLALSLKLY